MKQVYPTFLYLIFLFSEFGWKRCANRSFIVMLLVLVAEIMPQLDLLMGLLGGLFTGPITFIIPPILYARLRSMLPHPPPNLEEEQDVASTSSRPRTRPRFSFREFFRRHLFSVDVNLTEGSLNFAEKAVAIFIVIVGIGATFSAIYFSIRGVVLTTQSMLPCLFNATAAASVID